MKLFLAIDSTHSRSRKYIVSETTFRISLISNSFLAKNIRPPEKKEEEEEEKEAVDEDIYIPKKDVNVLFNDKLFLSNVS